MLLVEAAGERFVVACEKADAAAGGPLDVMCGVTGRAFVAGWTQVGNSANFGWAATAFESRKQKAESRKTKEVRGRRSEVRALTEVRGRGSEVRKGMGFTGRCN
jgi:hypothetical protein